MQLMGQFGFFALVLVAIYWVNRAVGLLDALVGDGQSVGVFLQMSLLSVPSVIELITPMAAFGAALSVANKLSNDSEMIVLQATGFSFVRLARATMVFAATVAVLTALVTNFLIPSAAAQLREMNAEIARNSTVKYLKEGQFLQPSKDIVLFIRAISPAGELLDIFISDNRTATEEVIFTAQRAFLVNDNADPKLLMLDGAVQRKVQNEDIISISRFADFTYSLKDLINDSLDGRRGAGELTTLELMLASPKGEVLREWPAPFLQYRGHIRISWPISAGLTAMIGFAALQLGGFSRGGLWRQILLAICLLMVMYFVHIITLSRGPQIQGGWVLAYLTPLVAGVISAVLLWAAGRTRRMPRQVVA